MLERQWTWQCCFLLLGLFAGCRKAPLLPAGTGAKDKAKSFFEALVQTDWPGAYASLHATSRSKLTAEEFAGLAQKYRKRLGFEPEAVQIRAYDEKGEDATAHVVLTGKSSEKSARYKDAVTLKRSDDGWRVILPANFGH